MAKKKSSARITQREYNRKTKRQTQAGVIKLGSREKFQPLRIADIPKEEIERATEGAGQEGAPDSYPENAPEAADNPQAVMAPKSEQPTPEGGQGPGGTEEPMGGKEPQPDANGGPSGGQIPQENQGGEGQDKPEGEEKKPEGEGEENPEDEDKEDKEGEGDEGEGETPDEEQDGEDKDKKKDDGAKKEEEKGAKALAKAAWQAISKAVMSALTSIAGAVGWPVLIGCAVVALIILIILGVLAAHWIKTGPTGRTAPVAAGVNDPNVKKIVSLIDVNDPKLEIANDRDKEFIKSGKIDKRLAAALAYLAERHEHIRVSHIVSGYEDINTNTESGRFHDIKYPNNISAHKQGQAADIDEIDYVKDKCNCGSKIPVKVAWQTIGESPFAESPPDVLNQIKSPDDFANTEIKKALEKFGVKGLDQKDLVAKMKASQTLSKIDSPYDLTDPNVIAEFEKIGVTGIGNDSLQAGLKKVQALQSLAQMNLGDLNALKNSSSAKDLFASIGINMDNSTIDQLAKFQSVEAILGMINSPDDLANPQVQLALQNMGINANDPNFKQAFAYIQNANTIMNWGGNTNDSNFTDAMRAMGIPINDQTTQALLYLAAAQSTLKSPSDTIVSDVQTIQLLEKMGIMIEDPKTQNVLNQVRAAYNVLNWTGPTADAALTGYLATLNIPINDATMAIMSQFVQDHNILNNPQVLGQYADDFENLKAWQQVFSSQNLAAFESGAVSEVLNQLGLSSYPTLVGQLSDLSKILNPANFQAAESAMMNAVLNDLNIPTNIGDSLAQFGNIQALANIHSPADLLNPQVQNALANLKVPSGIFSQLGAAGSIMALAQINSPADLLNPSSLAALDSLGIISVTPELLGQIGSIQALMQVDSLNDLLNPSTILALNNLGLITLAGPVAAALMVASFIDNLTGGALLGGLLGGDDCKETTDCYKPTAQENIYKVVEELLQMPYDLGDKNLYRVTQLIVWNLDYIKQKDPNLATKLDQLYWTPRAKNVGLFTMPEAFANIHIGY